ncbi:MAG: FAD-dependent monooxygenase [Gammaproteobacteria bacterium]
MHCWALHDHPPLPAWHSGRVALLGDACHPMLPYLAQGAAMAIEDAWVLARMLDQWDEDPVAALGEYSRYRQPRATRVQAASREQGTEFHRTDRWQILKRNLTLGFGSRYLPELAMQRFDWLHGYDCVKGFH